MPRPQSEVERAVQFVAVVLTNLAMVPGSLIVLRHRRMSEYWCGVGAFLASTLYHLCETLDITFLGMTDGQWHRIDNIFAILSFCFLQYVWMQSTDPVVDQSLRWVTVIVVCILQEQGPWEVRNTILPVAIAVLLLIGRWVMARRLPDLDWEHARTAAIFFVAAMIFFVLGLHDEGDWARCFHGAWHICVGGMTFFWLRACERFDALRRSALDAAARSIATAAAASSKRGAGAANTDDPDTAALRR